MICFIPVPRSGPKISRTRIRLCVESFFARLCYETMNRFHIDLDVYQLFPLISIKHRRKGVNAASEYDCSDDRCINQSMIRIIIQPIEPTLLGLGLVLVLGLR